MDTDAYVFTGGGQIGKVFSSWPFVKLTVKDSEIRLSTGVQETTIARENIIRVKFKKRLFASEFKFEHNAIGKNPSIEFWSFSPAVVLDALKKYNYEITSYNNCF